MVCAGPAAIGTVLADTAVKSANVEVVSYASPKAGTSYSNEVILTFSGDSGAVRQAVRAAREVDVYKRQFLVAAISRSFRWSYGGR